MKTTYIFAVMTVLLTSMAAAPVDTNEGFNYECQNFYNGDTSYYTIEKWAYDNGEGDYLIDEESAFYFNIDVTGDFHEADWTSTPDVYSVLVKAGSDKGNENSGGTVEWLGGASGTVTSEKEISHITFCGMRTNGGGDPGNGVPEFSTVAMGAAVLTATLGIVFLRKK